MFEWRNAEHFQAVKLRGSAISQGGKETLPNRKPRKGQLRLPRLYAATRGHWGRERRSQWDIDRMGRSQTGRRLRPDATKNTNPDQRHAKTARRRIEGRKDCPIRGRGVWKCTTERNTADYSSTRMYTVRVKIPHRARRHPPKPSRKMKIRGREQKKLTDALGEATGQGKSTFPTAE